MSNAKLSRRPPIVVSKDQHARLLSLARGALDSSPAAADVLAELSRARIVAQVTKDTIGIESVVTFEYDGVRYDEYTLVYPDRADFSNNQLSVLTSVGAMLLGLSEGQTVEWANADGRDHKMTVLAVRDGAEHYRFART